MAIKISGSTIIDDSRQLVNVGVSTVSALNVSGNINANGDIIGDNATNISGISSITATTFFGSGINLVCEISTKVSGITVKDEGNTVGTASGIGTINFVGPGVTATGSGVNATITIPGFAPDANENLVAGTNAGSTLNCANYCHNILLGKSAGSSLTQGYSNVFIGECAGKGANNDYEGVAIGKCAGAGAGSVAIGKLANCVSGGSNNVSLGSYAGKKNSTGNGNVFLGVCAGCNTSNGGANIAIGFNSLKGASGSITGDHNITIGACAGCNITSGCYNSFFGRHAGCTVTSGKNNVAIGNEVQIPTANGNCQLAIGAGVNRWVKGDQSFNVCLGNSNAIKAMATGTMCATCFVGCGAGLTGIDAGFNPDSCENLVAGTSAGAALNASDCFNVLLGYKAGIALDEGSSNIAIGCCAAVGITTGSNNIIMGSCAGCRFVCGSDNIFLGRSAGAYGTSTANRNFFGGYLAGNQVQAGALSNVLIGDRPGMFVNEANVMIGKYAGMNACGSHNIVMGEYAMSCAGTGCQNIALGSCAGQCIASCSNNIYLGSGAGKLILGGNHIAIGYNAMIGQTSGNVMTDQNIAIGGGALRKVCGGCYNVALGSGAGNCLTTGGCNVFFGHSAGAQLTTGTHNIFMGSTRAGCNMRTGSNNIMLGRCTGRCGCTGDSNVFIGEGVAVNSTALGSCNVLIGRNAACGASNFNGGNNVMIGANIGLCATTAEYNVILGRGAGKCLTGGQYNFFVGNYAGATTTSGESNIAIGLCVCLPSATGNAQLAIGCSSNRWIQGDSSYNVCLAGSTIKAMASGGIFCATKFCGDGSCLTGIDAGFSPDSQGNLYAGDCAGLCSDSDTCYNIALGNCALKNNCAGDCNIAFGRYAGLALTTGYCNVIIGASAGCAIQTGNENILIGNGVAAQTAITGSRNLMIGFCAGHEACSASISKNIFLGQNAGYSVGKNSNFYGGYNTGRSFNCGCHNIAIGESALCGRGNSSTGGCNIAIGRESGCYLGSGNFNTILGNNSGKQISGGSGNTIIGQGIAGNMTSGNCNTFVGTSMIFGNVTGNYNAVFGHQAAKCLTSGACNLVMGHKTACCFTTGKDNIFLGTYTAHCASSACDNVVLGNLAGRGLSGSNYNVILGKEAGYGCNGSTFSSYNCNVLLGIKAGACARTGSGNVMIGELAGFCHRQGHGNVQIGKCAGKCNLCGCYNTYLGQGSSVSNANGNYNVAIGYDVDLAATGDCQLVIGYASGNNYWLRGDSSKNIQPGAGIKDCTGVVGASGQFLQSTGSEIVWAAAGGGGSGTFDTSISNSVQATIFGYETDVLTLASDDTKRYTIESISVGNVTAGVGSTVNVIASINPGDTTYSSENKVYIAYNIPVPDNGLVELIKQPIVMNPDDVLKVWATDENNQGINDALELYASYAAHDDTDFVVGYASTVSVATTALTDIYTSSSNPTVLQSIKLTNRTDSGDFPVTIQLVNGSSVTHLAKNLVIPRYASVELLDRPKRLETNGIVKMQTIAAANTIDVVVSGKKIT